MIYFTKIDENFPQMSMVEALAKEAFPPNEFLAPAKIIEMAKHETIDFWAIFDDEKFVGFTVMKIHKTLAYLFFLAIDARSRGQKYGSRALEKLNEIYANFSQVVDFEKVDETAPNFAQRVARKQFYLRNGFRETGHFLNYRDTDFEIMIRGNANFDFPAFKSLMSTLKIRDFSPRFFASRER